MAKNNKQKAQKMAEKGKSASQIKAATGVGSKTAQSYVAKYSPSPAPSAPAPSPAPTPARQTSVQQINKNNSLSQNLKIASSGSGILTNKELLKISKKNDKNPEKVLEKAVSKGAMVGSKVVNNYQKGAYTDPRTAAWRSMMPELSLQTGMDSPILQQMRNAGKQDKGSALFIGSKGSTATTLPRKMGAGNTQQPVASAPASTDPVATGTEPMAQEPSQPFMPEQLPEEEPMDLGPGMMSGGGMGAAGANKLGRAKSRLRKLGIYGRGTGLLNRGLQYGNALNA